MKEMTNFDNSVKSGFHYIYVLGGNLANVAGRLEQEKANINSYNGHELFLDTLHKSVIFFEYTLFEAISNLLSIITVSINNKHFTDGPVCSINLKESEIDILLEMKKILDNNGDIKSGTKFYSTSEKLVAYPRLFAKMFGIDYRLDKGGKGWDKFKILEKLRNDIFHPKFDVGKIQTRIINHPVMDFNAMKPMLEISKKDLFLGVESLRWYCRTLKKMVDSINDPVLKPLSKGLEFTDGFVFMSMFSLSKYNDLSEDSINQAFPQGTTEFYF